MISIGSNVIIISIDDAKKISDYLFRRYDKSEFKSAVLDLQAFDVLAIANKLDEEIKKLEGGKDE